MFAPLKPYHSSLRSLAQQGADGIIEFPVSVTPILRIPFFATLLLLTGNEFYEHLYKSIRRWKLPIHFQMHLSDFVDYSQPELQDQMPERLQGSYVPQALTTSLEKKLVLVGQVNKMELWDEAAWFAERAKLLDEAAGEGAIPEELMSVSL